MSSRKYHEELTKIRILNELADSLNFENGIIGSGFASVVAERQIIDGERVLRQMLEAGLVERRSIERHKTAKPYFITEAGKTFLKKARNEAMFPELGQRQDWSSKEAISTLQQAAADLLRSLPEFTGSNEARISEVSKQLADVLGPLATRQR